MGACLLTVCYVIHWQAYGYQDDDSTDYVNEIVVRHGRYPTTSLRVAGPGLMTQLLLLLLHSCTPGPHHCRSRIAF